MAESMAIALLLIALPKLSSAAHREHAAAADFQDTTDHKADQAQDAERNHRRPEATEDEAEDEGRDVVTKVFVEVGSFFFHALRIPRAASTSEMMYKIKRMPKVVSFPLSDTWYQGLDIIERWDDACLSRIGETAAEDWRFSDSDEERMLVCECVR
jgi:hypothetical protein